jgi:hypothetical protein
LYIQAGPTLDPAGPPNESFHTRVQGWPGEVLMVACEFELADAEEDEGDGDDEEEHAARLTATAIPRPATMVRDSRETLARNSLPPVAVSPVGLALMAFQESYPADVVRVHAD